MKSRPLGRAPLDAIDPSLQVPTYLMLSTTGCRQSLQTVPIAATDRAYSMTTASPEPTMRPCPAKRDSIVPQREKMAVTGYRNIGRPEDRA
jgi:hypothetical protein